MLHFAFSSKLFYCGVNIKKICNHMDVIKKYFEKMWIQPYSTFCHLFWLMELNSHRVININNGTMKIKAENILSANTFWSKWQR